MKRTLTALIVDDESAARKTLASLLVGFPRIRIVGEAGSVSEALILLEETAPDLIFLDVQMPGGLGTELLPHLNKKTRVVFVTAYDRYAVSAFRAGALDYLLKPVDAERLGITIERLAAMSPDVEETPGEEEPSRDPVPLLQTIPSTRSNGEIELLSVTEILWIEGSQNYTRVRCKGRGGKDLLFKKRMIEWEQGLPPRLFCRVSRSLIVQPGMIQLIECRSRDETKIHFKDDGGAGGDGVGVGEVLVIGRTATARLKEILQASPGSEG